MKHCDPWDLLTEQAKINNQDQGIEKMVDLLEDNKAVMDFRHATILMDYIELIDNPQSLPTFQRVFTLVQPFFNELKLRDAFRVAYLEQIIKQLANPTTNGE